MKVTNRKRTVIVILIMAMLITLVPTANVSAESIACLTEDPNADLYPFPLDMKVLSKYLYGSEENTKGNVATYYAKDMRPMDARSRKNGCPVRCHKALKTMGSRLMPWFTPRQQKSIFIRVRHLSTTIKSGLRN